MKLLTIKTKPMRRSEMASTLGVNNRKIVLPASRRSTNPTRFGFLRKVSKINKVHSLIVFLVLITILLEMFNIFLTNRIDTDSIIASQLQKEVAVLTQENNIVRAKVFEIASYESVASRAAEFGFKEAGAVISLDTPIQVARQ